MMRMMTIRLNKKRKNFWQHLLQEIKACSGATTVLPALEQLLYYQQLKRKLVEASLF